VKLEAERLMLELVHVTHLFHFGSQSYVLNEWSLELHSSCAK